MIREASKVSPGTALQRDICIIGAGAAGITLALELDRLGLSVCVLESGGHTLETGPQDLYWGEKTGGDLIDDPDYLANSRLRFLGGSTNHWAGYCSPLDPIDFEARPWIPNSGWPFSRKTLEPWYRRAAELLEIRSFDYGLDELENAPLDLQDFGVQTALYHLSPPTRFGPRYRALLENSRRILVLLHSNAVEIATDAGAANVRSVEVSDLTGRRFEVRAKMTILAAGAIENARLLLVSRKTEPLGLGNRHDLVGRYFMDHFYGFGMADAAFLLPTRDLALYAHQKPDLSVGAVVMGVLRLSDDLQQKHQLFNVQFRPVPENERPGNFQSDVADLAAEWDRPTDRSLPNSRTSTRVEIGSEIAPQATNRVMLSKERDALGLPRLRLHAATSRLDREALTRAVAALGEALGASLDARMRLVLEENRPFASLAAGSHHIGTTRMHEDPRRGVVDADCRVHSISNLYVAGSSVFPTSGRSNPTFTLVALALRLANHLADRMRG